MSSLQRTLVKSRLPPKPPGSSFKNSMSAARKRDYTPVSWQQYFHECKDVKTERGSFRVYFSSPPDLPNRPRLVVLHGGGYSALTWSLFTMEVTKMIHCQVVAIDFRGHGNSTSDDNDDLSVDTLSLDVSSVLHKLYGENPPPMVLIGHSMGGAIAVRVVFNEKHLNILGLAVIDVVEGTAMDALSSMQSFLRGRPSGFKSIEHAIEWCVRSGQTRNIMSAKVSMPGQIVNSTSGMLASSDLDNYNPEENDEANCGPPAKRLAGVVLSDSISEDPINETDLPTQNSFKIPLDTRGKQDCDTYKWRIDLSRTERHWSGWFTGLSSTFLACEPPKMLLLASVSGLDKELTVGQMQGKFQMQVLTRCGHAVHEDCPEEVAQVVSSFMLRHHFTDPSSLQPGFRVMPAC